MAASTKRKRASSQSPASSSTRERKYDVFLSFRGEDTRNNFTDHLFAALNRKGINTFRDEEGLERGKSISKLFKAIEQSQFAIIILSKNYASSTWCLDELAKIMKCKEEKGLVVLPLFYDVDPSNVRNQTGTFKRAFTNHQKRFTDNIKKVETWRATLREVADISGWHLHQQNWHEAKFIELIVEQMMNKVSSKFLGLSKNFIGTEPMVAELIHSYLGFEDNVSMIGIWGMGGLGKTTLASIIYDMYSDNFEGSSFIANVRERSKKGDLHELQHQMLDEILEGRNKKIWNVQEGVKIIKRSLCHKKVLLVLDDVNHVDQLEKLAGEHGWFGSGSWIIITTRDEHVLKQHGVLKRYNLHGLNNDDSLKLFCLRAFKNEQPKEGYMQLSQDVVKYANGLPLALVTWGSFLVERTIGEWESALNSLKKIKGEVFEILKISYDGLEEMWKEIFLDIACFFRWEKKDQLMQILEKCGFDARIGISVLLEKSLLTIGDYEHLEMHDLLQEMGEKVVHFESGGKLEKQSRLWLIEDLLRVLRNDMATEAIEAIVVTHEEEDLNFEEFPEGFSKMSNLRLLIIKKDLLKKGKKLDNALNHVPNDRRHLALPNNLRYLSWSHCPFKSLASSSQQKKLVQLELKSSKFEYLWEGVMLSTKLKFIDLSQSENLIKTPDFSGVPMLEVLNLSYCSRLVEIHPSVVRLSSLRCLNLKGCLSLTDLPNMSAEMQSLTVLTLDFCSKISSFPKFTGIMKSLLELKLGWTGIKKVTPSSIECLPALTLLDLINCRNLKCLPSNMDNLRSLKRLILSGCEKLQLLPRLPSTIRYINAQGCCSLRWTPAWVKLSSWSQPLSQWRPYDEDKSRVEFTVLFHLLQLTIIVLWVNGILCHKTVYGTSSKREDNGSTTEFQIIIPSCLIQTVGNSISIELPSNWYNRKWIGFTLWASLSGVIYSECGIRARVIALGDMPQNHCASKLFTTWTLHKGIICQLYLSRDDWFAKVGNGKCSQIKIIFETHAPAFHVHKCGFSLVYEQDVDKFNQTNAQCQIKSFGEESIYKLTVGDDEDDGDDDDGEL